MTTPVRSTFLKSSDAEGDQEPGVADGRILSAVHEGCLNAELLLACSPAQVNFQDADGMTALHHAVAVGARADIGHLVASGKCDYLLTDRLDRYASDIAIEWARDYAVGRLLTKLQCIQAEKQAGAGQPTVPRRRPTID